MTHTPVLLQEVMKGLAVITGGRYIDATAGEGGHTVAMLQKGGVVLAVDRDKSQIAALKNRLSYETVHFAVGSFGNLKHIAESAHFMPVNGILFDLGLSYGQLAHSGRGFSYKNREEPLDMRINPEDPITAADIIRSFTKDEIYAVLSGNAEEMHAESVARELVRQRSRIPLTTVADLCAVIDRACKTCSVSHPHGSSVYAQVFQAFRIEVNREFEALEQGLNDALEILAPGGRTAVITFHSLEDRIVKRFISSHAVRRITRHPVRGSWKYSYSRSAKLRIFEKL